MVRIMIVQEGNDEGNTEIVNALDITTGRMAVGPDVEQTF